MPFDAQGNFTRVHNWTNDYQNDIEIVCDRHDEEDDNFAAGFNDCFCRDGRATATGNFKMGNFKITGLGNGTIASDAVNKAQLDNVNSTLTALISSSISTAVNNLLDSLYPVGSVYIGTQATCPMASLIADSTWELVAQDKALWTGDGTNGNTTIAAGLPNHTHGTGRQSTDNNGEFVRNSDNEDYVLGTKAGSIFWNGSSSYNDPKSYLAGSSMNEKLGYNYSLATSLAKTDNLASDGVWGNSTTVQPPAYVVNVWRRTA